MAEQFKNFYNYDLLRRLAVDIQEVYEPFQIDAFLSSAIDDTWDALELKDRLYKVSTTLGQYLPADFKEAIGVIDKVVMNYGTWLEGFSSFFPIFVEVYGLEEANLEVSIAALGRYTQYASSELAIRAFIIKYEDRMLAQMYEWSKSGNEHLRRLSSEGCRPALPWGQALSKYKKDPTPILPILEQLKADPELFVRKSVANNLNDISKTHPELVVKLAREWYGKNEYTNWIVKHACRTLLKKGNRDVLAIFGYDDITSVAAADFAIDAASVSIGGDINFSFAISTATATKVRLEYGIDFVKANGKRSRKIFQISEIAMKENDKKLYTKKHSFADLSTRKHYVGVHSITLIVNGTERGTLDFEVVG